MTKADICQCTKLLEIQAAHVHGPHDNKNTDKKTWHNYRKLSDISSPNSAAGTQNNKHATAMKATINDTKLFPLGVVHAVQCRAL